MNIDLNFSYMMEKVDLVLVGAEGVVESGGIINKVSLDEIPKYLLCVECDHCCKVKFCINLRISVLRDQPLLCTCTMPCSWPTYRVKHLYLHLP